MLFKFCSICSVFTITIVKIINYSFNLEKIRHYLENLFTNIYIKIQILYWVLTFGIHKTFVLIQYKYDKIVLRTMNIAVT
jgi:hypothetical protein